MQLPPPEEQIELGQAMDPTEAVSSTFAVRSYIGATVAAPLAGALYKYPAPLATQGFVPVEPFGSPGRGAI
jgi:hypothetical protein